MIYAGQTTELILDFDAARSVVKAGKSGKYLLKPTIKVIGTTIATVSGVVTNGTVLEGVLVSAQIYTSDAVDAKDRVAVQAATVTDENGEYMLYVQPGDYNIVAYEEGYAPECTVLDAQASTDYAEDFNLTAAATGTLSGTVTITGGGDEDVVTVSIRQDADCDGDIEEIEVASFNIANGGDYSVTLGEGSYTVVASTDGEVTQQHNIVVTAGGDTPLDITF